MSQRDGIAAPRDKVRKFLCEADRPVLAAGAADGDHQLRLSLVHKIRQQEIQQILGEERTRARLSKFL